MLLDSAERSLRARRTQAAGNMFENILSTSCGYYKDLDISVIEKTPEPMRPIKPYGNRRMGQFIAVYEKQAQPDYKGILCDGTTILFEAKHTDTDRIKRNVVTETQEENFNSYQKMGAHCFVMVSIRFEKFFRVPWNVFSQMKERFGRKYMTEDELEIYRLKMKNGTLLFLEGVELNDN